MLYGFWCPCAPTRGREWRCPLYTGSRVRVRSCQAAQENESKVTREGKGQSQGWESERHPCFVGR